MSELVAQSHTANAASELEHGSLRARGIAYLIDSVVLFAFTMLFVSAALINIFLRSDYGRQDPSDAALRDFAFILMATVPAWLVFNLVIVSRRGQTIGHYVVGLRVVRSTGERASRRQLLAQWLALHPLLYHPFLAGFWLALGLVSAALAESNLVFIGSFAVGGLCLVAPLAGLLFALGDPQRRGIHDWIAGLEVVRIE